MAKEQWSGQMALNMKVIGSLTCVMVKVYIGIQMVTNMKACGKMIKLMVLVNSLITMVLNTMECGKMISNMVKVLRNGLTTQSMMATTEKERNMDMVIISGLMQLNSKVIG